VTIWESRLLYVFIFALHQGPRLGVFVGCRCLLGLAKESEEPQFCS
jgi:hypothetical protein